MKYILMYPFEIGNDADIIEEMQFETASTHDFALSEDMLKTSNSSHAYC